MLLIPNNFETDMLNNLSKNQIKCTKFNVLPIDGVAVENGLNGRKPDGKMPLEPETKLYKKRFWMLFLFSLCTMLNGAQFLEFSIISNIMECYHDVGPTAVNYTTTVFMILYLVLVLPVTWFISRYDIKMTVLAASFFNCLSGIIQCFSVKPSGFALVIVSQAMAGVAQVFVLPVPPRLAALWFGPKEISRAISIGVCANLFGAGLGFVLPPIIVPNECSHPELIKHGRSTLAYMLTGSNVLNFLLLLATFQTKPPIPPNESSKVDVELDYKKSLLNLAKNTNFIKLTLNYGLATGMILAFATVLNQMIQPLFPGFEEAVGWMGIVAIIGGIFGGFATEYILDVTHKFKEMSLSLCILGLLSLVAFTGLVFIPKIWVQFVTIFLLGFFLIGYFPVGLDFAAEITYPEPEGTSAGIMNTSQMALSAAITIIGSYLLQTYSMLTICLWFCSILACSTIICFFIKPELRRTKVNMLQNGIGPSQPASVGDTVQTGIYCITTK